MTTTYSTEITSVLYGTLKLVVLSSKGKQKTKALWKLRLGSAMLNTMTAKHKQFVFLLATFNLLHYSIFCEGKKKSICTHIWGSYFNTHAACENVSTRISRLLLNWLNFVYCGRANYSFAYTAVSFAYCYV